MAAPLPRQVFERYMHGLQAAPAQGKFRLVSIFNPLRSRILMFISGSYSCLNKHHYLQRPQGTATGISARQDSPDAAWRTAGRRPAASGRKARPGRGRALPARARWLLKINKGLKGPH